MVDRLSICKNDSYCDQQNSSGWGEGPQSVRAAYSSSHLIDLPE
ncbi:hypothetical protein T10_2478 [Trichinella papuae]|uniref:Uncharacterized protein n=1 Tax=Trichinella papuae TaxID=268474 RepID=A0A0V1MA98_9BILA|nr:hypothetical protein T10_2478 [Trichinella papuae]